MGDTLKAHVYFGTDFSVDFSPSNKQELIEAFEAGKKVHIEYDGESVLLDLSKASVVRFVNA